MSDEELIRQVLDGNDRAFETLVERHQDTVAKFIWRIVPNPQDREEVCQDVFVKVFFNLSKFRFDARFTTWLYQVAYRTAVTFNRRKRLTTQEWEDDMVATPNLPEQDQDRASVRAILNKEIEALQIDDRVVMALFYLQELGIEEISQIVDRPAGTIKSVLYRVRGKLRHNIERNHPALLQNLNGA